MWYYKTIELTAIFCFELISGLEVLFLLNDHCEGIDILVYDRIGQW